MKSPMDVTELENSINYKFKDKNLLIEALSHPSLKKDNKTGVLDYERLEMLGDSILNFIVSERIFKKFLEYREGKLAKIKAYLVSGSLVSKVAMNIDLPKYILLGKGEETSGGRSREGTAENALEALIGAIYLDGGIEETKNFVRNLWDPFIENMDSTYTDPKSKLQEWSQEKGYGIPKYKIEDKAGQAHDPLFTVTVEVKNYAGTAKAGSIKAAQKKAAAKLLESLKI